MASACVADRDVDDVSVPVPHHHPHLHSHHVVIVDAHAVMHCKRGFYFSRSLVFSARSVCAGMCNAKSVHVAGCDVALTDGVLVLVHHHPHHHSHHVVAVCTQPVIHCKRDFHFSPSLVFGVSALCADMQDVASVQMADGDDSRTVVVVVSAPHSDHHHHHHHHPHLHSRHVVIVDAHAVMHCKHGFYFSRSLVFSARSVCAGMCNAKSVLVADRDVALTDGVLVPVYHHHLSHYPHYVVAVCTQALAVIHCKRDFHFSRSLVFGVPGVIVGVQRVVMVHEAEDDVTVLCDASVRVHCVPAEDVDGGGGGGDVDVNVSGVWSMST